MICTFFGHKNAPSAIRNALKNKIIELIENRGGDTFYVGNQGGFDSLVIDVLKEISVKYSHIRYYIVLAYMPGEIREFNSFDYSHSIFPEGIEDIPYRFAISYRNKWMANKSDTVICYINHTYGGAWSGVNYAEKQGKEILTLQGMKNSLPQYEISEKV